MEERIKAGDIVKHFKRENVEHSAIGNDSLQYLYEVLSMNGFDTKTEARVVVYKALYGTHTIFVRPYDDFMSEVNREKYPHISQTYKFEQV